MEINPISKYTGWLDAGIMQQLFYDLTGNDRRAAYIAALYILPDGRGVDEDDPYTFTALCDRHSLNPDVVAKAMWDRLPKKRKKSFRRCFKRLGFNNPPPSGGLYYRSGFIKRLNGVRR